MDTITIGCQGFQNRTFSIIVRSGYEAYEREWEYPFDLPLAPGFKHPK